MPVRNEIVDGVTVLHVPGDLFGGDETDALERAIQREEAAGNLRLVVDLSQCNRIDSTALGVLIAAHGRFGTRGAQFKLHGLQDRIVRQLRRIGLPEL